jgi:hypothetical protein
MHLFLSFMVDGVIMEGPDIMVDTVAIMEVMVIMAGMVVDMVVGIIDKR